MLSLDNAYSRRRAAGVSRPHLPRARSPPDRRRAAGLRRRAEDRRTQHRADLRARTADAGGDTRRRRRRRGRHRECARHPNGSADAPRRRHPTRWWRSAARCSCPLAAFARMNEEREAAGEPRVCQPAQRGGRHDPDARQRGGGEPRPSGLHVSDRQTAGPRRARAVPRRRSAAAQGMGMSGRTALAAVRRHRRRGRVLSRMGREAPMRCRSIPMASS